MPLIALKCPSCGAELERVDGRDFFFCQYCGAKIEHEKQRVELSGNVNVSGIGSKDNLIERARLFMEDGDFDRAEEYIDKVLDIDVKFSKAYFWKTLADMKYRSVSDMIEGGDKNLELFPSFQKAMNYASDEEKERYNSINKKIIARLIKEAGDKENVAAVLKDELDNFDPVDIKKSIKRCQRGKFIYMALAFSFIILFVVFIATKILVGYVFSFLAALSFLSCMNSEFKEIKAYKRKIDEAFNSKTTAYQLAMAAFNSFLDTAGIRDCYNSAKFK